MLYIRYSKYGTPRADEAVIKHCEYMLKSWAKPIQDMSPYNDHISQFVVLDIYRSLILQNTQYKEFVKFYIDGNELVFDKYMISDDEAYIHLSDIWSGPLAEMTMLRMKMRKEEKQSRI